MVRVRGAVDGWGNRACFNHHEEGVGSPTLDSGFLPKWGTQGPLCSVLATGRQYLKDDSQLPILQMKQWRLRAVKSRPHR